MGVPLITPVEELIRNPAGRDGLIVQVSTMPPEFDGVREVIVVEIVPFIVEGVKLMFGAATVSTIVSVFLVAAVLLLPELSRTVLALTSKVIEPVDADEGVRVTV